MATDQRQAASARLADLIKLLQAHPGPGTSSIVEECEALSHSIAAFHMEAIRFRMFTVDRQITRAGASAPAGASALLEEVRRYLEVSGFHTRSH